MEDIRKALSDAVGPEETERILQGKRQVVTSCGSGMTAGVLWLGLQLLGVERVGLYDEVIASAFIFLTLDLSHAFSHGLDMQ